MSHFTVLVIHEAHDDLSTLLAPFDENREDIEPYKERVDIDEVGRAIGYYAENPGEVNLDTVKRAQDGAQDAQLECLAAYNGYPLERVGMDEEGYFRMTTYNPDSKWDWWQVGGRWGNYFDIKPECDGEDGVLRGQQPAIGEWKPEALKADSAPKRCIDIEGMRERAGKRAGEQWDAVHAVIDPHPPAKPWTAFVAEAEATGGKEAWDAARAGYHAQPRVRALREASLTGFFDSLEDYEVDRSTYVARAEAQAVPGFATLYKGEWIAPGRMGWWATTDATDSTKAGYGEYVNGLIDMVSDDTIFTIVDCHI